MDDKKDEYSYRYPRESAEGQKRFYHCTGFQLCPCCMFILKHSNSRQCSICAITKNNTPLINNANISLKTTLINRKPLILVGKSNRTLRKSQRLQKMKENN